MRDYSDLVHRLPDGTWTVAQRRNGQWYRPLTARECKATGASGAVYGGSLEGYARYHGPIYARRSSAVRMARVLFFED